MAAAFSAPPTTRPGEAPAAPTQSAPSALELEHVLGHKAASVCHPSDERRFVTTLGPHIVVADVLDPHAQTFLRGHDADVTALDVGASGRFIASGQARSPNAPAGDSMVVLWDFESRRGIYNFFGIIGGVSHVRISPDEKFLAAAGFDLALYVWDLATGEVVFTRKFVLGDQRDGIRFLSWGPVITSSVSRRPAYTLAFNVFEKVHVAVLEYDFRIMRYNTIVLNAQMPAAGFVRTYTSGTFDPAGNMVMCGTTTGEVAVFSVQAGGLAYKTALLAASNGVLSLLPVRAPIDEHSGRAAIYVGGGDGTLRCFTGSGLDWVCTAEARLYGPVTSLSIAYGSSSWMLAGTAAGLLYRVSFGGNLHNGAQSGGRTAVDLLEVAHTGAALAACFHPSAPEAVATVSADRSLRLWNLNTYGVTWTAALPAGLHATALWVAEPVESDPAVTTRVQQRPPASAASGVPGADAAHIDLGGSSCDIFAGFSDGSLRAYEVTPATVAAAEASVRASGGGAAAGAGQLESWRAVAHRGAVSCVTGNRAIIVTGGPDGRVTVWSRRSHDLLISFNDHTKPVVAVVLDCVNPEILYSVGQDRIVNTYSLRAARRLRLHSMPQPDAVACNFTAMVQLTAPTSERELVCATSDGRVFIYDPAVPDSIVGSVDVLALLVARGRAAQASGVTVVGEEVALLVPKIKPGQSRAELRFVAASVSRSGQLIALVSSCSRLIVLELPPASEAPAAAAAAALTRRATFTDQAGKPRQLITSPAVNMRIVGFLYCGRSNITDVKWAPDEKQLFLTCADSLCLVVNYYG